MWLILKPAFMLLPYWKPCPAFMPLVRLLTFETIHMPFSTIFPILNFTTPSNLSSSAIFYKHLFPNPLLLSPSDCPLNFHTSSLISKPGFSSISATNQEQHPRWPSNHRCAHKTCSIKSTVSLYHETKATRVRFAVFVLVTTHCCNLLQADMRRSKRRSHCTTNFFGSVAEQSGPNASIEESPSTVAPSITPVACFATSEISTLAPIVQHHKQSICSASQFKLRIFTYYETHKIIFYFKAFSRHQNNSGWKTIFIDFNKHNAFTRACNSYHPIFHCQSFFYLYFIDVSYVQIFSPIFCSHYDLFVYWFLTIVFFQNFFSSFETFQIWLISVCLLSSSSKWTTFFF